MREFARECLIQGGGAASLYQQAVPKPSKWIFGHSVSDQELKMTEALKESKFLPIVDLISLLQKCAVDLKQFSPHPVDECIAAIAAELVEPLIVSLVRTPPRQASLDEPNLKATTANEERLGKEAAAVGAKIISKQRAGKLDGENYVKLMNASPHKDLTRAVLKQAQGKGSQVSSTCGDYSTANEAPISHAIQCKVPQILKVRVQSLAPNGRSISARVVDFGSHAEFWKSFPDARIHIDVLDVAVQNGLILSRLLDEDIELELSISIGLQQARGGHDSCRGSLLMMPNIRGIVLKAIRRLNEQMSLNLQFPDQIE